MRNLSIGILILAHKNPEQVLELCKSYSHDNIITYIHVDKKTRINDFIKVFLEVDNVVFIENRISINWGGWSMVNATLKLLKKASIANHDYYFLISGEDLLLKKYDEINKILANKQNIYIRFNKLPFDGLSNEGLSRYERYSFKDFYSNNIFLGKVLNRLSRILNLYYKRKLPYNFIPYYGSQWFTLPNYCVKDILHFIECDKKVLSFFKKSNIPDEMFFQTIILNSIFKDNVQNENLRFIKWSNGIPHPEYLDIKDIEIARSTDAIFARKYKHEDLL